MVVCRFIKLLLPLPPVAVVVLARRQRIYAPEAKPHRRHGKSLLLQSVDEASLQRGFATIAKFYASYLCALQDVAPLSPVRLYLQTGLKHQLHVHMAHALGGALALVQPLEAG